MQTLWNRIVQTKRACKCSASFSSAAACTRRATTAVFRTRLSSKDRFTVIYSSFLTAATLIDSQIKGGKREKLLGAIEEARDELNTLDTSQKIRLAALSTECDDIKELFQGGRQSWKDVLRWAEEEKRVRNALGFKKWKGIPLSILESLSTTQLEEAFRNNSVLRKLLFGADSRAYTSSVCSTKKRKIMEWSTAKLAYRFLREIYREGAPPSDLPKELGYASDAPHEMKQAISGQIIQAETKLAEIRMLPPHSEEVECFVSSEAPRYNFHRSANDEKVAVLNSHLEEVFQLSRKEEKNLKCLITKVCRYLLASNAPPNIRTYTLLARNFERLGQHGLIKAVLEAMKECRFRSDEEALSFWLDYYSITNNVTGFRKLVTQMHGFSQGLTPAHVNNIVPRIAFDQFRFDPCDKDTSQNISNDEDSLAPIQDFVALRCRDLDYMVFRTARKNQDVYSSLIRGTLKLFGEEKAMGFYVDMIRDGHEPTVEILTIILHHCCEREDWESGLRVLQEIHDLGGGDLQTYRLLLQLCQKCQDRQKFKEELAGGVRRGIISPAVQYFPEQIDALQAEQLLDRAGEYGELLLRFDDEKPNAMPSVRLARWLGVIGHQMSELALEVKAVALSAGQSPAKAHFLCTRIKKHRSESLDWAEGKCTQVAIMSHHGLIQAAVNNIPEKASNEMGDSSTKSSFTNTMPIRFLTQDFSIWEHLLQKLLSDLGRIALLMSNLAREFGDIELLIRHGPTTGHMLHAKMVVLKRRPLLSFKPPTRKFFPRQVHDSGKHGDRAPCIIQASISRPKQPACRRIVLSRETFLTESEGIRYLRHETRRETLKPEKAEARKRVPVGMKAILPHSR
jgi:hypothetical protein